MKVNKTIRLVDKTTGKRIYKPQPRSLMTAREQARKISKRTGHTIEVLDQFGSYFTAQPNGRATGRNPRSRTSAPVRVPARITPDGRVFVSAGAMRKLNPHSNPAYRIVPITKERYERHIRPLLRSPYSLQPFAVFKRTQGRGQSMLFHGDEFIKGGTKTFLKKYAKREAGL